MKKLILFLLWTFLFLFPLVALYVSYNAFITEREGKVADNVVTFLTFFPERRVIPVPYPELTVIKVKKGYQLYATANAVNPIDLTKFEVRVKRAGDNASELYLKKPTPEDFLLFLMANPLFGAMLGFSFLLYAVFFYFTARELEGEALKKLELFEAKKVELVKRLKALKVLLATENILKGESRQKAKALLDELSKKLENK